MVPVTNTTTAEMSQSNDNNAPGTSGHQFHPLDEFLSESDTSDVDSIYTVDEVGESDSEAEREELDPELERKNNLAMEMEQGESSGVDEILEKGFKVPAVPRSVESQKENKEPRKEEFVETYERWPFFNSKTYNPAWDYNREELLEKRRLNWLRKQQGKEEDSDDEERAITPIKCFF